MVLLVTGDFLASDFIFEHELPPLLDAAKNDGLRILWVAVSFSMYSVTALAKYQAANDPDHPLDSLKGAKRDRALVEIVKEIRKAMEEPMAQQSSTQPSFKAPERTVEVITELYRRLTVAERAFTEVMFPLRSGPSSEAIRQQVNDDMQTAVLAGNGFLTYLHDNRIWLPGNMSDRMESLAQVFVQAWTSYHDTDSPRPTQRKYDAWQRIVNEVPQRRKLLEADMRLVLGTETGN